MKVKNVNWLSGPIAVLAKIITEGTSLNLYLINCKYFTEINQKFLCSGHSFLTCDRDFAVIEKNKRSASVMVPSQWKHVVAEAFPNIGPRLQIKEMEQQHFKDLSCIESRLSKPAGLKITEVMWLKFCNDDPCSISVRKSHSVMRPWVIYNLLKNKNHRLSCLPALPLLPVLYRQPLPITMEKKKDVTDMCQHLKHEYRAFYNNLTCVSWRDFLV